MNKYIYHFNESPAEDIKNIRKFLGNKGAGLVEAYELGLPVPLGFTITTEVCSYYYQYNNLPISLQSELSDALQLLEQDTGKIFGSAEKPLLLSVRSGSIVSMPGMMDTVLNLGMNDRVCEAIANITDNRYFALDCYRRFLAMYGSIVLAVPSHLFEEIYIHSFEQANIKKNDIANDGGSLIQLKEIIEKFKAVILKYSGQICPTDPYIQLQEAIIAVLNSWRGARAVAYRKLHNIMDSVGTAVTIQSMVFGNLGNNSATGVVFTRCPATGQKKLFGEFLMNAQGEEIVSGSKTPMAITSEIMTEISMQKLMPDIFLELENICTKLELYYRDVQDIEFTVEDGKLYLLQTRNAKRTAQAAVKIAVDMVYENTISKEEALLMVDPESLQHLLHSKIDYNNISIPIAQGLPASPGAATGIAIFCPFEAECLTNDPNNQVILIRRDTSPEDIKAIYAAAGILTSRGGMTSHAAVVTRGIGKPCVCGVNDMVVNQDEGLCKIGKVIIKQGDEITIDGTNGKVFLGKMPLLQPIFSEEFIIFLKWADEIRNLQIRANAETKAEVTVALDLGAEGIGLCRTEHMFFEESKISLMREMIIAPTKESREYVIAKLLPLHTKDFKDLFHLMQGRPINIRLLDPPLHEFLPTQEADKISVSRDLGISIETLQQRLHSLKESNPMLGHRGCRLGISYPEIYRMQTQAIRNAAYEVQQEGIVITLELMIPFISNVNELKQLRAIIHDIIAPLTEIINVKIGTMIEIPRAALQAGIIAQEVDFFSFGTNDLTQTTYGISRDDGTSFLQDYIEQQIFTFDPFIRLDEEGVGELINIAVQRGKLTNPKLKLGACGEHAGNPNSIIFFQRAGIDYVSCSPYRLPIVRVAAAQAKILTS